ncbi:MAG: phenylalanine--tRNA ligase subunit alpha [Armatimonadota bacterium]|nr:phenylalanine--tRNA ligase subunit alpha [Armatimonadota bacterium]MDR7443807.1 phenylalanine--tRNA ligase subunit alpha [Armatimonadota bacterium]MDR7569024.1 phenylalanine--tRNA ligase subunit alpha [Armatimonadota bacterium]MDR7613913.1 phenylalanine--tRNA ligase subunit alpha [Armatimonadota bacterium]
MEQEIRTLREEAGQEIQRAESPEAVEAVRRRYLGKRGRLTQLLRGLGSLPPEERARVGALLNETKAWLVAQLEARAEVVRALALEHRLRAEAIDVTLPGRRPIPGRPHVLGRTIQEILEIFRSMGFEVVEGPEIETEEFNFRRLNIPEDHPARDMQDSFYLDREHLLRTQVTAVDVRVMAVRRPPLRVVSIGRCYRRDALDATHAPVFHQVDGFLVDEGVRFSDLKGVLSRFAREMWGPQTRVRFQPSYFPFTEPSAEIAVYFGGRWLEIGGCGMFHPRVLEFSGIDPERYTAFAFGLGVERPAMVRYGIGDIRLFWENDLRFLNQF